jgi:transcription elongation GreA/GreB family factor
MASELQEQIDRAQIFDPTTLTTARISFGTTATLKNNNTNEDEVYTILGPWESDPENKVISYLSPFGKEILNSKEGDSLSFEINERKHSYTVISIKPASL